MTPQTASLPDTLHPSSFRERLATLEAQDCEKLPQSGLTYPLWAPEKP